VAEQASSTRVIVADDEVLLREGLVGLLEQRGYDVVGQAGDGSELIRLVREHQPDLAIVDIRMPPTQSTEGLDAASAIRDEFPETAILILSAHVEIAHAMTLLGSGRRSGYLLKSRVTDIDEFLETLERVCRGGSVVDPALVQELIEARRADDPLDELTPSERTVENHVHSILRKLRLPETDEDHRRVLAVLTFLRPSLRDSDRVEGRSPARR
jgi:DNA-binding NarL/FixJ family response regulator